MLKGLQAYFLGVCSFTMHAPTSKKEEEEKEAITYPIFAKRETAMLSTKPLQSCFAFMNRERAPNNLWQSV